MKKSVLLLIILAFFLIIAITLTAFLLVRRDIAFRIFQRISSIFRRSDLKEVTIETQTVDIHGVIDLNASQMLINKDHMIPESYEPTLTEIDGHLISREIADAYLALQAKIRNEFGDTLLIRSSYRTKEEQEEIYGSLSSDIAAQVGASEHQIGMSLDVYMEGSVGGAILESESGRYLHSYCHEYGFIIRYPYGKSDITGISYEPWHIRYVGKPHAEIIYNESLTLEEYILEFLKPNVYYQSDTYYISRQIPENGRIEVPKNYTSIEISPDNCGGYIVTAYQDRSQSEKEAS